MKMDRSSVVILSLAAGALALCSCGNKESKEGQAKLVATPLSREAEISSLVMDFIADYEKWNDAAYKRGADPRCIDKSSGASIITEFGIKAEETTTAEFKAFAIKYFKREVVFRSIGMSSPHHHAKEKIISISQLEKSEWRVVTHFKFEAAGVEFTDVYEYFVKSDEKDKLYIDYIMFRNEKDSPPLVFQDL